MTRSVSERLAAEHSVIVRPGGKAACPKCGHNTLSVRRDDTIAKCFHPSCDFRLFAGSGLDGRESVFSLLYAALGDLSVQFHECLLSQKTSTVGAYRYVAQERSIHPQVITDSDIGAVPSGIDVRAVFAPYIDRAKEIEQPKQRKKELPEDPIAILESEVAKLQSVLDKAAGWLVFNYTDASHRTVAFRFRQPDTHTFMSYKPTNIGGAFNHGLFSFERDDALLVVEGEFNALQLQSLMERIGEREGKAPGQNYVFCAAAGGVQNVDVRTIVKLSRDPFICYDNDADEAGFALVESVRRSVPVRAFTTPTPGSDLDKYILGFGDIGHAYQGIRNLIANATRYGRPYEGVKAEADTIRRRKDMQAFDVNRSVADAILQHIRESGKLHWDSRRAYVSLPDEGLVLLMHKEDAAFERFLRRYGIAPSEDVYRFVTDALRHEAANKGEPARIHYLAHYDEVNATLYVSNLGSKVYRITPDRIDTILNGEDGVLFLHDARWEPFELLETRPSGSPFADILVTPISFSAQELDADHQKLLLTLWIYALFFPELFPTRMLLVLIGEAGSGKSWALRLIGCALFGAQFHVTKLSSKSSDFDAQVAHSHLAVVDNADTAPDWLEDHLAVVATGGTIKLRELYTTLGLVEFPIRAFVALTSRTPDFRREDVAERVLALYVERRSKFEPPAALLKRVRENRAAIMTELIGDLQEIVRALAAGTVAFEGSDMRMADFAAFAMLVGRVMGREEEMAAVLHAVTASQARFALADEPLYEALRLWIADARNNGRKVSRDDLRKELRQQAERSNLKWPYDTAREFGQRLTQLLPALRRVFRIEERDGHARMKNLWIWKKQQPRPSASSGENAAFGNPRDV